MALNISFSATFFLLFTTLVLSSANNDVQGHGSKPYSDEKDNILSTTIGIQGMVYCKQVTNKPVPLEGNYFIILCLISNYHSLFSAEKKKSYVN